MLRRLSGETRFSGESLKRCALTLDGTSVPTKTAQQAQLRLLVYHCRRHGIVTLTNALMREEPRLTATSSPDTWLAWLTDLGGRTVAEIRGDWKALNDLGDTVEQPLLGYDRIGMDDHGGELHRLTEDFSRQVLHLRARLLRGKLDCAASMELVVTDMRRFVGVDETPADLAALKDSTQTRCTNPQWTPDTLSLLTQWDELARGYAMSGNSAEAIAIYDDIAVWARFSDRKIPSGMEGRVHRLRRMSLLSKAEAMLDRTPLWHSFDRISDFNDKGPDFKSLVAVERLTQELEDIVRECAESSRDYSQGRAKLCVAPDHCICVANFEKHTESWTWRRVTWEAKPRKTGFSAQ